MTFPGPWGTLALQGTDVTPLLALLGSDQPAVANVVRSYLGTSGARVSMVGVDHDPAVAGGAIPPNANVLIQPSLSLPLDFVAGIVQPVIGQLPGVVGAVTRENVTLPGGESRRFTFQISATGADGTVSTATLQTYLLTHGPNAYLITFVTLADEAGRDDPIFDSIIGTFAFTP